MSASGVISSLPHAQDTNPSQRWVRDWLVFLFFAQWVFEHYFIKLAHTLLLKKKQLQHYQSW